MGDMVKSTRLHGLERCSTASSSSFVPSWMSHRKGCKVKELIQMLCRPSFSEAWHQDPIEFWRINCLWTDGPFVCSVGRTRNRIPGTITTRIAKLDCMFHAITIYLLIHLLLNVWNANASAKIFCTVDLSLSHLLNRSRFLPAITLGIRLFLLCGSFARIGFCLFGYREIVLKEFGKQTKRECVFHENWEQPVIPTLFSCFCFFFSAAERPVFISLVLGKCFLIYFELPC